MKKNLLDNEFLKEVVKVIILMSINIYFNKDIYDKDMKQQVVEIIAVLAIWIIYLIVFWIHRIVKSAIEIEVILKNKLKSTKETEVIHGIYSREDSRTVVIKLKVKKSQSAWGNFGIKQLKNKKIKLVLNKNIDTDELVCVPAEINQMQCEGKNISVEINDILIGMLKNRGQASVSYEVRIDENRDHPPQTSCEFELMSNIVINQNNLNFLDKLVIDFKDGEFRTHKVNFYM